MGILGQYWFLDTKNCASIKKQIQIDEQSIGMNCVCNVVVIQREGERE